MSIDRVKFQDVVESQLPRYVREDFPLLGEFLEQYYVSQEFKGAPADLAQNIDQYVKIDELVAERSKKEDGIDYTDMTYAETHVYKFLEVSKSINGIARKEGVGILTGNYQPYIDRGASSFLPRKKG